MPTIPPFFALTLHNCNADGRNNPVDESSASRENLASLQEFAYPKSKLCTGTQEVFISCVSHMESVESERITGVWVGAPSGVQGQSPWSRGQRRSPPPKAETTLAVGRPNEAAKVLPSSSHVYSKHSVTNHVPACFIIVMRLS